MRAYINDLDIPPECSTYSRPDSQFKSWTFWREAKSKLVACRRNQLHRWPMDLRTWLLFVPAAIPTSLSPGAAAVASMSSGASYGVRRSYWTIIGLELALMLQLTLVAIGLGALLAASEVAFSMVKWCGALYLAYLGLQPWRKRPEQTETETPQSKENRSAALLVRGFLINGLNPKSIVFFLAVTPQFISQKAPLFTQYAQIGTTLVAVDLIVMGGYSALGSRLLGAFRKAQNQVRLNRVFGTIFIGAAGLLALARRNET
jgi:homoserine/homoserine lactone efflux protein